MTATSKIVVIVEGPDGAGKTSLARDIAERLGAAYVHHGPYQRVRGIARLYVESMLPALLGYQAVVLDRSWLSEAPYSTACRNGADRLGVVGVRMLDRLALRCGAVVVRCDPGWDAVAATYRRRVEYLTTSAQLANVYDAYRTLRTAVPIVTYDYTRTHAAMVLDKIMSKHGKRHFLSQQSAGQWSASIAIVGDSGDSIGDTDVLYRWPFAAFDDDNNGAWLTAVIEDAGIEEGALFWTSAQDLDERDAPHLAAKQVIALGADAEKRLDEIGVEYRRCVHPVFRNSASLVDALKRGVTIR